MKLDEYVRETLLAIVRGVVAAQQDEELGQHVGRVANTASGIDLDGNPVTSVRFDLATTSEDKGTAGGGISVVPFLSAKGDVATAVSSANRLQFSLPLSIPKPEQQRVADEARRRRVSEMPSRRPDL